MKQVIFVGGTAFSGSTFFHLILANDPKGFACGEVSWLFHPRRADHVNRLCGCGDPQCPVWPQVLRNGEERLYETIFAMHPEVGFIVDSSKSPFWIRAQMANLHKQGIAARNVLIWKTPLEFANSSKKRKRAYRWDVEWVNYHRLYVSLIKEWRSVRYFEMANQADALLPALCDYLGLTNFPGKKEYWNKTHHALGGNRSAKFHLYAPKEASEVLAQTFDSNRMSLYRSIYYTGVNDPALEAQVKSVTEQAPYFAEITQLLDEYDVTTPQRDRRDPREITLSPPMLELKRLKNTVGSLLGRYKFGPTITSAAQ
jgi:hypothetical protein